jgi:4-hydroxy-tetrahydrodipicolinate reductase
MTGHRLAIIGHGKMGRAIEQMAADAGFEVAGVVGRDGRIPEADVAIEFTEPRSAVANIRRALEARCAIVVGTTGWYEELPATTREVERVGGAMLWAPNFSVGAHIFRRIAEDAARHLAAANDMDPHIVETHHRAKVDAPSGTAAALGRVAAKALGRPVPITSIRLGSVPGRHELLFDAPFEQIRLVHDVRDRRVFAAGALRAARWLAGRRGVFTLDHVLGDRRVDP